MIKFLFGLLLSVCLVSFATADERTLYAAEYEGDYMGIGVDLAKSIRKIATNQYEIVYVAENFFGKIEEHERFFWEGDSIVPISYSYHQKIFGSSKKRNIFWNWKSHKADFDKDGKKSQVSFPKGTLGPLSYQLQLQIDVSKRKDNLSYKFIRKGQVRDYTFHYADSINANTAGGAKNSSLLTVTKKDDDSDKQTILTFDLSKRTSLVELEQIEDDAYKLSLLNEKYFYPLVNTPLAFVEP